MSVLRSKILKKMSVLLTFFTWAMFVLLHQGCALQDASRLTLESGCVCPGYTVIFAECTVVADSTSGTATIWRGSAFNCTGNEISLRHSLYQSRTAVAGCNNGAIVGKGVGVEDNHYTSQLNITISSNMIGKTVECILDNSEEERMVGSLLIATPGPFPPPDILFIGKADLRLQQLVFNWSSVASDCPIQYNILASNCGSCSTTTNHTTVTCIDVPVDSNACTFAVQSVVCGSIVGNVSNKIAIKIQTNMEKKSECTVPTVSAASLGVAFFVSGIIFTILIVIIVSKLRKKELSIKQEISNSDYDTVQHHDHKSHSGYIDTKVNVAYCPPLNLHA